jgi:hypothetical protein
MPKIVRELGPLAFGVAVFGLVIGLLLQAGNPIGNWLLAAFLVGHGWVHMMYVMQQPRAAAEAKAATAGGPEWAFELDRSWLLSAVGTPATVLHGLGRILVVITVGGYMLAGLATIPLFLPATLWAPLVLVSTFASLALLVLFFHRNLLIGLAISAVLLWVVVTSAWVPG